MIVLVQSSFHTTWASLFEMELEPNSLDWIGNELEHELELEDMKHTFRLKVDQSLVLWGRITQLSCFSEK